MAPHRERPASAAYVLRVDGHLDHHWSPWFGGLTLTHEADGTTSLTGVLSDQAQLHGLLAKIRDLGVPLLSLAVLDPPGHADPTSTVEERLLRAPG
jgi:hypothetical protein